jgi:hypothetical protein
MVLEERDSMADGEGLGTSQNHQLGEDGEKENLLDF